MSVAILKKARAILAEDGCWCQDAEAIDIEGTEVSPLSSTAVQFCALGAVARAAGPPRPLRAFRVSRFAVEVCEAELLLGRAAAELFPKRGDEPVSIVEVNDHSSTTQQDVLHVFDRAIELAGETAP